MPSASPTNIAHVLSLPPVFETVVHILAEAATRAPDAPALACGAERLTYREYLNCVAAFACRLIDLGARGQRVAVILGNGPDHAIASFAIHAAGAQLVPLNPAYTPYELEPILADAAPRIVIVDAGAAAMTAAMTDRLGIAHRIVLSADLRLTSFRSADAALPQPLPHAAMLATLQYTGGTTGRPKGVDLAHGALAVNISQREALLPTQPERDRVLAITPLFHSYAMAMGLFLAAYARGLLVILPRYRPELVLAAIAEKKITLLPGSPTIFNGLLGFPGLAQADLSSLRLCYSGSSALPEETLRRWEAAAGCPICEGYGQTEAGPVLTFNPQTGVRKPGSVGIACPATEVEIVDVETGTRVLPPGQQGEIRARGPQIMRGYRTRPHETREALRDGWLYTGDIGEVDADGYFYVRDRKKDMVIVAGFNVYPREVEEVLYTHPAVAEAAVIGVPDAYRGEALRAFVALHPQRSATAEGLIAFCAERLTRYKVPDAVVLLSELPKTTVGKIAKTALRAISA